MQISQIEVLRGPRPSAVLLYVVVAAALLSSTSALNRQDTSRRVSLCGQRLVDAVLDLCNYKLYDPVDRREFHVIDDNRPAGVASSGGGRSGSAVRRSDVQGILNRNGGLSSKCCQTQCTISDMALYCAA